MGGFLKSCPIFFTIASYCTFSLSIFLINIYCIYTVYIIIIIIIIIASSLTVHIHSRLNVSVLFLDAVRGLA